MEYDNLEPLLKLLLPLGGFCFSMAFVRVIFIKQEESVFVKALKFYASALFGIICGYLLLKFVGYWWAVGWASFLTLIAEQTVIWINKFGLKELLIYLRVKIQTLINPNNPPQPPDGK